MTDEPADSPTAPEESVINSASSNRGWVWFAVALVAFGGCTAWVYSAGGGADEPTVEELEFDAFEVCKDFVTDRLRAPSTATFRNFFQDDGEVQVTGTGDGPYRVVSTVDAENGFGAKIRSDFYCVMTLNGDRWTLDDIFVG